MSGSSTESAIFSSIPGFEDDADDVSNVNDQSTTNTGTGEDSGSAQTTSAAPTSNTTGVDQQGSGSGTANDASQQQQEIRRRHDGLVERPNADNPNTRDLVDPRTGQVVARGGIERRVFEDGQRHARENQTMRQQLQRAQEFVNGVNDVTREAHRLGIDAPTQMLAIQTMAEFIRDPVRTLENLVAEVKSRGIPIPFLEQGISPGIDMSAIQRMIDAKMAPITNLERQNQERVRNEQQLRAQVDGFLNDFPEAEANLDTLGGMLKNEPGLTLPRAYNLMVQWATRNGLDYTQPLKPQVEMRRQQNNDQQPTQPPMSRSERPLPGATRTATPSGARPMSDARQFNENASWSDIIRQSMAES